VGLILEMAGVAAAHDACRDAFVPSRHCGQDAPADKHSGSTEPDSVEESGRFGGSVVVSA
jgi:hypothetical protein